MWRLKFIKLEIKKWCREEGIKHEIETKPVLEEIEEIDRRGGGASTTVDIAWRESFKIKAATRHQMEKISWRQKSGACWIEEGDHNTRLFRCLAIIIGKTIIWCPW